MKLRSLLALTALLLSAGACRDDRVSLDYRYPTGTVLRYTMTAHARASWEIGTSGSGSYDIAFDITEEIVEAGEGEAVVEVTMSPTSVREHGLPSPGPEDRSFRLRVGSNGEVLEVLEVAGIPASSLDTDELAFIGTYRPPLPLGEVRLADTWRSRQRVDLGSVSQEVETIGRLRGLDVDPSGDIADLHYEGGGPLSWTTSLPQGAADLSGSSTTTTDAEIDLSHGLLKESSSTTRGTFDVQVVASESRQPLTGTLQLDLELSLERA